MKSSPRNSLKTEAMCTAGSQDWKGGDNQAYWSPIWLLQEPQILDIELKELAFSLFGFSLLVGSSFAVALFLHAGMGSCSVILWNLTVTRLPWVSIEVSASKKDSENTWAGLLWDRRGSVTEAPKFFSEHWTLCGMLMPKSPSALEHSHTYRPGDDTGTWHESVGWPERVAQKSQLWFSTTFVFLLCKMEVMIPISWGCED